MFLADSTVTVEDVERGWRSIIISGLIILAMIGVAIWWLKRQT